MPETLKEEVILPVPDGKKQFESIRTYEVKEFITIDDLNEQIININKQISCEEENINILKDQKQSLMTKAEKIKNDNGLSVEIYK